MHLGSFVAVLTLIPAFSWGQLSPNTVMVTSSGNLTAQPDQALFSVSVNSGIDKSLDDILKALGGSGITAEDLAGISSPQFSAPTAIQRGFGASAPPIAWAFYVAVPLPNIQTETASLMSLQTSISQNNSGLTLSFYLENIQSSSQQFQSCDSGSLVAAARTQAQTIANAAGVSLTSIVNIAANISQASSGCSLAATFALGFSPQPGPHTITMVPSRTLTSQPDQVLIGIYVTSGLTTGLDKVNSALAGAGITGANLSGVTTTTDYSSSPEGQSALQFTFTLVTPLANLTGTLAQIASAVQTSSTRNSALNLSFSVAGLQASPQSQPVCPQAGLIADGTAQAQKVAAAAGLSAGPLLSISTVATPIAGYVFGVPSGPYGDGLLNAVEFNSTTSCSLAVQFQLN
jgi:hypothetical protein